MLYNDGYIAIAVAIIRAHWWPVSENLPEIWNWNSRILEAGFRGECIPSAISR